MPKLLLIEDDMALCQMLSDTLTSHHFSVDMIHDGQSALACLQTHQYDLIILDWELPDHTGIEIANYFRSRGGGVPILMLTGKRELDDKAQGFEAGVDDYLTKPFDMRELIMRVKALLRRPADIVDSKLEIGDLVIEPDKFCARKAGRDISLTKQEFQLLEFLMRHRAQVFSPEALLDRVWSLESDVSIEALRACVIRLRKKIDANGKSSMIQNIYGLGYKLDLPAD